MDFIVYGDDCLIVFKSLKQEEVIIRKMVKIQKRKKRFGPLEEDVGWH